MRQRLGTVTTDSTCSYMLRILGRRPTEMRLDRMAAYLAEFAALLGSKNEPTFSAIKDASTGFCAAVPPSRQKAVLTRIYQAKSESDSRPAGHLRRIETLLSEDDLQEAELQDGGGKVIYLFRAPEKQRQQVLTIKQSGQVDGMVTGLVGADDTMHLHLRDALARDLRLIVRDESLARALLAHFRSGLLRLQIEGRWVRTDDGWVPEANRCVVHGFEVLDETSAAEIFQLIGGLPGNGWRELEDPLHAWRDLRGLH